MGNLLSMPYSEITATLEHLAKEDVTQEDMTLLRRFPGVLKVVAGAMMHTRELLKIALGDNNNKALSAIEFVSDADLLIEVVNKAKWVDVQLAALRQVPESDSHRMYDVARLHPEEDVVAEAVRKIGWSSVSMLRNYVNEGWRENIVEAEWKRRLKEDHNCVRAFSH